MLRAAVRISLASPRTGSLLTRMVAWKAALAVLKRMLPLRTLVRLVEPRHSRAEPDVEECVRVQAGVRRLGRVLGGADCLERSLVTYRFLARAGARPTLRIGFDRDGDRIDGHAWVTVGEQPVSEHPDDLVRYVELASFTPQRTRC